MKIALAHHWLIAMRGGEKVLEQISALFPHAPIYTLVARPERLSESLKAHLLHTSLLQEIPGGARHYKNLLPLFPFAVRRLQVMGEVDFIFSSDASVIKGLHYPEGVPQVCYCHSPPRYLWDMQDTYLGNTSGLGFAGRLAFRLFAPMVRRFDREAARRVDHFIANSRFVQERIKKCYGRESVVIHPPVALADFDATVASEDFYLVVSELTAYKRVEIAVEAFNRLGKRLVVIGNGSELARLKKMAGPNVTFLGSQPFDVLKKHYETCRAFVFPGIEDFGITPLEAQAAGKPVIGLAKGGLLETTVEGETAVYFHEQTAAALADAVRRFEGGCLPLDPQRCRAQAQRFSPEKIPRGHPWFPGRKISPPVRGSCLGGRMSRRLQAVGGASWSVIEGLAGQGLSVVIFFLLARLLSPADFGVIAIANVYILITQCLVFQGLGQAIVQFEDLDDDHLDAIFWFNLGTAALLFFLTLGLAGPMARWFHEPALADILRALSPVLILGALTDVQNNLLARRMQFRALALRTLASYVAGGVVSVAVALRGGGAWSLVAQQLTIWTINLLVLWTASGWRPRLRYSAAHGRRLLAFSLHLLYVDLLALANRRADQLFVGRVLGPVAVGFYSVGARLAMLVGEVLIRSVSRVSTTVLARVQTEAERLRRAVYEITEMQNALILPLTAGLILVAPDLIRVGFGAKWIPAVPIMQVLLVSCPFEALSAVHQSTLIARGQPGWCSVLTTLHAVLNVALIAVAIHWGAVAVAGAFSLRAVILYPVELAILRRAADFSPWQFLKVLAPQVAAVLLMAAAVLLVRRAVGPGYPWMLLVGSVVTGAVTYVVLLAGFNRRLMNEFWRYRALLSPSAA